MKGRPIATQIDRHERREEEREAEPLGEEGGEEARVIVEARSRARRRRPGRGGKKLTASMMPKGTTKKTVSMSAGKSTGRSSASASAVAPHGFSTTQSSGLIRTPTSAPSCSVGPVARGGDGDDLLVAAGDIGLDARAEIAHEGHASAHRRVAPDRRAGCPPAGPRRPRRRRPGARRPGMVPPGTDAPPLACVAGQDVGRADEGGDEGVARTPVDVERRADLADAPFAHDDDQVRHGHRLALVVRDDDGGDAEAAAAAGEAPPASPRAASRRAPRAARRAERAAASAPARGRSRRAAAARRRASRSAGRRSPADARAPEARSTRASCSAFGDAADAERIGDVVADGQMRKERQRLEHHAEIALMRVEPRDVGAVDQDAAGGRLLQPGDHPKQRRLPAAGRPEQADEGAVRDGEIDVLDRRERRRSAWSDGRGRGRTFGARPPRTLSHEGEGVCRRQPGEGLRRGDSTLSDRRIPSSARFADTFSLMGEGSRAHASTSPRDDQLGPLLVQPVRLGLVEVVARDDRRDVGGDRRELLVGQVELVARRPSARCRPCATAAPGSPAATRSR